MAVIMIIKVIRITALFLTAFIVVGISAYLMLTVIIKSEETVTVPDLSGKSLVETLELLTELGLNTKVNGSEYSNTTPKHHILFQDPIPGMEIKKDRDVRIILSKGAESIIMPDLRTFSIQQARIVLEENDLSLGASSCIFSSSWEKDQVITHTPPQGTVIHHGERVNLLISMGPRPIFYKIPDFSDLSLDEAVLKIGRMGLRIGEIKSVYKADQPLYMIASQEPGAGYRIQQGSPVALSINREKEAVYRETSAITSGPRLFRFRLQEGFMKKRIRIQVGCYGFSTDFYNDLVGPGAEIWSLIPGHTHASVFLFQNEELIKSEVFDT